VLDFGILLYPSSLEVSHPQTEIRLNFCVFLWEFPPHCLFSDLTCINLIFLILLFVGFFALRTTARRFVLHISSHSSAAKSDILKPSLFTTPASGEIEFRLAVLFRAHPSASTVAKNADVGLV